MKYFIKHKLFLCFGVMVLLGSFVLSTTPVSALEQKDCPTGTKLLNKDDTICCPSGQKPAQVHGQGVQRSCCPAAAVDKAIADGKGSASITDGYMAKYCLFSKYLNPLVNLLSAVVGVVVVIGIIVGAIQFSSSAGDPQKAANGKNHIRNALIGLLAYILLYAFLQFIIPGGRLN
jgi:hypothetical protein